MRPKSLPEAFSFCIKEQNIFYSRYTPYSKRSRIEFFQQRPHFSNTRPAQNNPLLNSDTPNVLSQQNQHNNKYLKTPQNNVWKRNQPSNNMRFNNSGFKSNKHFNYNQTTRPHYQHYDNKEKESKTNLLNID